MANEGYAVHQPQIQHLLDAILAQDGVASAMPWEFISDNPETVDAIRACEGVCIHESELHADGLTYLGLFSQSAEKK